MNVAATSVAGSGVEDRWIRSRLNATRARDESGHRRLSLSRCRADIWHFIYDDFCDWYIELTKVGGNWGTILSVFEATLRLLHPLMPFITEELWHQSGREGSISLEPYPQYDPNLDDPAAEAEIQLLQDIVRAARNLRADLGLDPKQPLEGASHRRAGRDDSAALRSDVSNR